jgi:hypothetical protein
MKQFTELYVCTENNNHSLRTLESVLSKNTKQVKKKNELLAASEGVNCILMK